MSKLESSATNAAGITPQYRGEPDLFCRVIAALKQANHNLCVLHGYKNYPEGITSDSDIDAISENPQEIPQILVEQNVAQVVQVLQHEATAFSYVLHHQDEAKSALILLDVSQDYRRNGRVFFRGQEFLLNSKPFKFFQIPSSELEFAYYIVKKIAKGAMDNVQAQRLSELYREQPAKCDLQLQQFFAKAEAKLLSEAARSGNWQAAYDDLPNLRSSLLGKVGQENPLQVLRFWLGEVRRVVQRIQQPTGLMVVFLGADGSGKSTAITEIQQRLAPAFRQTQYTHLRPRLGLKVGDSSPEVDPHGQPARSWLASVVKLFYFLGDYGLGFWLKTYPQLIKSTLVVYDRYYHDLLVDPKRFRYGGSLWLAKLIGKFIPQPDLWILLDAPAEILQARKQEVSFEETARQREEYLNLIRSLPNGYVVDASMSVNLVAQDVQKIVLDHLQQRTTKRLDL